MTIKYDLKLILILKIGLNQKDFSNLIAELIKMKNFSVPVLILLFFLTACSQKIYQVQQADYQENISISNQLEADETVVALIAPYKRELQETMDKVISYTPIALHRDGYNSPLANLNCDMVLEEANLIYQKKHNQKIDLCVLNWGGIRRTFTAGDLTVRNVFELMPFENEVVVVTLSGEKIPEMMHFLSNAPVGHPLSGIQFVSNDESSILINGEKLDKTQNYTIVTNDFLQKGGDQMSFFENPVSAENLGIKQRDLMMNYFGKNDTIRVNLEKRILDK